MAPEISSTGSTKPRLAVNLSLGAAAKEFRTDTGRESEDGVNRLNLSPKSVPRSLTPLIQVLPRVNFTPYHKRLQSKIPRLSRSIPDFPAEDQALRPRTRITNSSGSEVAAIGVALGSPVHSPNHAKMFSHPSMPCETATVAALRPEKEGLSKVRSQKCDMFTKSKLKKGKKSISQKTGQTRSGSSTKPLFQSTSAVQRIRKSLEFSPQGKDSSVVPTRRLTSPAESRAGPTVSERIRYSASAPTKGISRPNARDKLGRTNNDSRELFPSLPELPCRKCFLDVEIPDVTMERHSIMFGNLGMRSKTLPSPREEIAQDVPQASTRSFTTRSTFDEYDPNMIHPPSCRSIMNSATLPPPSQYGFKVGKISQEQHDNPRHGSAGSCRLGNEDNHRLAASSPAKRASFEHQIETLNHFVEAEKKKAAVAQRRADELRDELDKVKSESMVQLEEAKSYALLMEGRYNAISSHWRDQSHQVKSAFSNMKSDIIFVLEERRSDDVKIKALSELCDNQNCNIEKLCREKEQISRLFEDYKITTDEYLLHVAKSSKIKEGEQK